MSSFWLVGASNGQILAEHLGVKFCKLKDLSENAVDRFLSDEAGRNRMPKLLVFMMPTNPIIPGERYYQRNVLHVHKTANMSRPHNLSYVMLKMAEILSKLQSEGFTVFLFPNLLRAFTKVCSCEMAIWHHPYKQVQLFKQFEKQTSNLLEASSSQWCVMDFILYLNDSLNLNKPRKWTDTPLTRAFSQILQPDVIHLNSLGVDLVSSYILKKLSEKYPQTDLGLPMTGLCH